MFFQTKKWKYRGYIRKLTTYGSSLKRRRLNRANTEKLKCKVINYLT